MKLWLDDLQDLKDPKVIEECFTCDVQPLKDFNFSGSDWVWAKTADEAIAYLSTGQVTEMSLDYNLEDPERSGWSVVDWLDKHPEFWLPKGAAHVHSSSKRTNDMMSKIIDKWYKNKA